MYNQQLGCYEQECAPELYTKTLREMIYDLSPKCEIELLNRLSNQSSHSSYLEQIPPELNARITTEEMAREYIEMTVGIKEKGAGALELEGGIRLGAYLNMKVSPGYEPPVWKKVLSSKKSKVSPLLFAISLARKDKNEPKEYMYLAPLQNGGYYITRVTTFSEGIARCKKSKDITKVLCNAFYNRFNTPHGHPVMVPSWVTDGAGCENCKYAPHNKTDEKKDIRCVYSNYMWVYIMGCPIIHETKDGTTTTRVGNPTIYGPLAFEISGAWGYKLMTGSDLRLPYPIQVQVGPMYQTSGATKANELEITPIENCIVIEKENMRIIQSISGLAKKYITGVFSPRQSSNSTKTDKTDTQEEDIIDNTPSTTENVPF